MSRASAISFLVDKLHVATSDTQVVRHFARRLRAKRNQYKVTKAERKAIYREALKCHRENRSLYTSWGF